MMALTSSSVCCSSSRSGLTPSSLEIAFASFVRAVVNGPLTALKTSSGLASARRVSSARVIASIFGTCSPTVMWIEVTST